MSSYRSPTAYDSSSSLSTRYSYKVSGGSKTRRHKSFVFLASIAVFSVLFCVQLTYYQSSKYLNGTVYKLQGNISIPKQAPHTCPYFRLFRNSGKHLDERCDTCAIVSNSGRLLHSQAGHQIDSNQCVFRMNAAETSDQFKKDVGSKTTFRLLSKDGFNEYGELFWREQYIRDQNPYLLIWDGLLRPPRMDRVSMRIDQFIKNVSSSIQLLFPLPPSEDTEQKLQNFPSVDWNSFEEMRSFLWFNESLAALKAKIYISHNYVKGLKSLDMLMNQEIGLSSFVTQSSSSTGFYTMVVASFLCDKISVFGMSSPESCNQETQSQKQDSNSGLSGENNAAAKPIVPYHYWDTKIHPDENMDECAFFQGKFKRMYDGHKFLTEHAIFKRWTQYRDIQFLHPSW